jgi:hypothetical protein
MTKQQAIQAATEMAATYKRQAVVLRKPYNFDSPSTIYYAALYDGQVGQRTVIHAGELGLTEDTAVYVDRVFSAEPSARR